MKITLNIMDKDVEFDLDEQLKVIHRGYTEHDESLKYLYIVMLNNNRPLPHFYVYIDEMELFIPTGKDIFDKDVRRDICYTLKDYRNNWVLPLR